MQKKTGVDICTNSNRDDILDMLMKLKIEPNLPSNKLIVIFYYPSTQSVLSRVIKVGDNLVAERFEIQINGMEIANGYHELSNRTENEERFKKRNLLRMKRGKEAIPIDYKFLQSIGNIPNCCGASIGFDRICMLKSGSVDIQDILPFNWGAV